MSFSRLIAIVVTGLLLSGCRTYEAKNGEVPTEYLSQVQNLLGTYQGRFENQTGLLKIELSGNKPVVTFSSSNSDDLISAQCHSSIGELQTIHFKGASGSEKLDYVSFAFDRGQCVDLVGNTIEISFKTKDSGTQANLTYLAQRNFERVCHIDSGAPPNVPPHEVCEYRDTPVYYQGSFIKQ